MGPDLTIRPVRIALSIAGSDPTGGAGLQLDLQVFRTLGVHGAGVVTALTVQDTVRVHRVLPAFPSVVLDQLRCLAQDLRPHAIKLGMLATEDIVRSVALGLAEFDRAPGPPPPLVIDPVLAARDGSRLLERRAVAGLLGLFPRAALVTPNLPEAAELTGRDVSSEAGVLAAARAIVADLGAPAALVKGGHAEGPLRDLLAQGGDGAVELDWLPGSRIPGKDVHGTGCALAAAVAAGLARGVGLRAAVEAARRFVAEAIRRAEAPGAGAPLLVYP
jgi:hydroxymethylpyrimidine/phosphomethylpyrimidine kinase